LIFLNECNVLRTRYILFAVTIEEEKGGGEGEEGGG
jgi:hypothetical protein